MQTNSATRAFEYPWAFFAGDVSTGDRALEIGGGLSGFQFALDRAGARVVNVDPGMERENPGWACDPASHARLNRAFGTHVELRSTSARDAGLERGGYDRAFCISVLEHLDEAERRDVLLRVHDALRPGGLLVLTIDLFLNVAPFAAEASNRYGTNVDVRVLGETAPFELIAGERSELHGFPQFDTAAVRRSLPNLVVGAYPALAQCLVLRRA